MHLTWPLAAATILVLALSGCGPVPTKPESGKAELDQATFAESEDSTQVAEEKAIQKKDGMAAPTGTAASSPKKAAKGSAGASTAPK
jgi:hypothetical protein